MYICIEAVQGAEYTLFSWGTLAVGRFREVIAMLNFPLWFTGTYASQPLPLIPKR